MNDMFDNDIGHQPKPPLDKAYGFDRFWKAWPPGDRKVGKAYCKAKWINVGCAKQASLILSHVEYLKTSQDWIEGRVPMPQTYINQRRWDGFEPADPQYFIPKPHPKTFLEDYDEHCKNAVPMPKHLRRTSA